MVRSAILLLIFAFVASTEDTDVFVEEPHSDTYYVQEGASGIVLPCVLKPQFANNSQYEVHWTRYNNGHLRIIARNDKLLAKKDSIFGLLYNPTTGNYSLQIQKIQRDNVQGTYHCNVIANDDSGVQHSTIANVVVLVAPGEPIVSEAPIEPVSEGDTITLKCLSVGGSPAPTYTWQLPNGTQADERLHTEITRDGTTESTLHFRVNSEDNGSPVSCSVFNRAMNDDETKTATSSRLNVIFKPQIHVSPLENTTHLSVEEGETVNLTCKAHANPIAHSYEWKHLSTGERYQAQEWSLKADRSMNGDFECRATNQLGDGSGILKLNVQYTPKISVPISVNPSEKENVEIECLVDANPEISEIKWIGPNGFKSDGPVLTLKSISRSETGNYTCVATNFLNVYGHSGSQQRVGTGVTVVDVKRKPGAAEIVTLKQEINVGESIELNCNAIDSGNPRASYKWASPSSAGEYGTNEHDRETLIVRNAQLSDNGKYKCLPYNELGAGSEAYIIVTVIEPAKISSPLTTERIFSAGETKKNLECEAQGYPTPVIQWYKEGELVDMKRYAVTNNKIKSRCAEDDYCTQTVSSSLVFSDALRWSDKGNFTCVAENGGTSPTEDHSSWTIVRVLHAPLILNQKFGAKGLAAADLGSQARLRCRVSARPEPEYHWMFKDAEIKENEKYSLVMEPVRGKPDEYEQILQIENAQEKDYGEYLCRASNGNGGQSLAIELRKTEAPQLPADLQKHSSTAHSIVVGWTPNFDGGFRQTYVVEYKKLNSFTGSIEDSITETIEVRNATKSEIYKDDDSVEVNMKFNLTGLTPLSTYYIRIKATNEKGSSEFTPMFVASTNDVTQDINIMSPVKLIYNANKQTIDIDPKPPLDTCTLLYVKNEDVWRAGDCFSPSNSIPNIVPGNQFKARFCMARAPLQCSPISSVLNTGSNESWRNTLMVPFLVVVFVVLAVLVGFIVCCRTHVPSNKALKLTPVTLSSLPVGEGKDNFAHGSQADSGVFTLDRMKSNIIHNQHTFTSDETTANWANNDESPYDVSSDPYLNAQGTQIFRADGDQQLDISDSHAGSSEEEDGRRVMREIIV